MKDQLAKTGIVVNGIVDSVDQYKDRFSVLLIIQGIREKLQVGLKGMPDPKRFVPGENIQMKLNIGNYNGRTFFNEVA